MFSFIREKASKQHLWDRSSELFTSHFKVVCTFTCMFCLHSHCNCSGVVLLSHACWCKSFASSVLNDDLNSHHGCAHSNLLASLISAPYHATHALGPPNHQRSAAITLNKCVSSPRSLVAHMQNPVNNNNKVILGHSPSSKTSPMGEDSLTLISHATLLVVWLNPKLGQVK